MSRLSLETSASPLVKVESQGNLYVKGWDRNEVRAQAKTEEDLTLQEEGEQVLVSSLSNCDLRVPFDTTLLVEAAHGKAYLKSVTGPITVSQASADLTLKNVGPAEIEFVGRDLNAKHVQGSLSAKQVGRFVNVRDVSGDLSLDFIGSHLNLSGVAGNVSAEAGGNASLKLDPKAGQTFDVEAHGVITCRVPSDLDAEINIASHGPITIRVGEVVKKTLGEAQSLTLGAGGATINLSADGPVSFLGDGFEGDLADFDFDFFPPGEERSNFSDEISASITGLLETQLESLNQHLESQLSSLSTIIDNAGVSREQAERITEQTRAKIKRAQEKIRNAQKRAARKIAEAQRRAERNARKAALRAERHTRRTAARSRRRRSPATARELSEGRTRPASEPEPDLTEERLAILNMLAEKKITIEEAETLLSALEGQEG